MSHKIKTIKKLYLNSNCLPLHEPFLLKKERFQDASEFILRRKKREYIYQHTKRGGNYNDLIAETSIIFVRC